MLAPFLGGALMSPSFQRGLSRARRGRLGWFKGLQRNKKATPDQHRVWLFCKAFNGLGG